MLRTENIALNTSKKHSFAINHIGICQGRCRLVTGQLRCEQPHWEWLVGGLGAPSVAHTHHKLLDRRPHNLAAMPPGLLLAKGKGWFYLQTVKSNLCWIHLEADPEVRASAKLRVAERLSTTGCKKMPSSVILDRFPSLLWTWVLLASCRRSQVSFYKSTPTSNPELPL